MFRQSSSRLPRLCMAMIAMAFFSLTLADRTSVYAADEDDVPPTRVRITVELPAELPNFDDAALVAILYEHDPRLADAPAAERDRVIVRHLGHQKGIEQSLRFAIGDPLGAVRADRRYYISCRIYKDLGKEQFKEGKQLHYCHNEHPSLPGTVYDPRNGKALTFTAR